MSKWHYLSIIVLSLILILVLWQSPPQLLIDVVDKKANYKDYPNSFLVNTKTTQYNAQGKLSHILEAVRIDYFTEKGKPENGYSLLKQPDMQFYDSAAQPSPTWQVSATKGTSDLQGDEILLTHDVVLSQENIDGEMTRIYAEDLLIKTNEQYAITRKPVIIKSPSGTTTADGLEISLNTEIVKLLANVKSRYKKTL